jgi:imidazolonepropionase-like amidohydrolase
MLQINTAIENTTLYDGAKDRAAANSTLLLAGEKIAYAGPHSKAPAYQAAEVIDGRGLFALPGLIDLHVHGLVDEKTLFSFLRNGVTSIRDLASDVFDALAWKAKEQSGLIASPRLFVSGPVLTCPRGYPENVWGPKISVPVQGRYQAQDKVKKLAGMGVDVIKLGMEHELGPCLSETEVSAIVAAARACSKRVTAHITNEEDFEVCVKSGVNEVAHVPARPVSDDLWKEAVKKKVMIIPTLHAHAGWAEEWKRRADHPFGQYCQHGFRAGHHQCQKNLERFLSLGGQVAYGTDAGNPHMPFGVSVKEWKDLQSTGLTSFQCLKMATRDAAKVLGLEDKLGTLEKGKFADLALYQHDPLKDPQYFRTLKLVFKGGRPYPAGDLEFPQSFDLDYWIHQWEKTKFKPGWQESLGGKKNG